MKNNRLFKRICAGLLSALMLSTSIPQYVFAETNRELYQDTGIESFEGKETTAESEFVLEEDEQVGTIEETRKDESSVIVEKRNFLAIEDEEDIEDDDTYVYLEDEGSNPLEDYVHVSIEIENISTIRYTYGAVPINVPSAPSNPYDEGKLYYSKNNLQSQTSVEILVPKDNYLFIVGIDKYIPTYCDPIVKYDGYAVDYNDGHYTGDDINTKNIGHYDDSKSTVIKGWGGNGYVKSDNGDYWEPWEITEGWNKTISIKSKPTFSVEMAVENISSFEYVVTEDPNDVVESVIPRTFTGDKSTFYLENIPSGYTLCIHDPKKKIDDGYFSPVLSLYGNEVESGTITKRGSEAPENDWYLIPINGEKIESKDLSLISEKYYNLTIGLDKTISRLDYAIVKKATQLPVNLEDAETGTEDDLKGKSSVTISGIPYEYYVLIYGIEATNDKVIVSEAGKSKTITPDLVKDEGENKDGYSFKIIDNKNDVDISSAEIGISVKIQLKNIESIQYVVAADVNKIKADDLVTKDTAGYTELEIEGIQNGSSLIITNITYKDSSKYSAPIVTVLGTPISKRENAGTVIKTSGSAVLAGYVVATNIKDSITSGISIVSEIKNYTMSMSSKKALGIGYAYAETEADLDKVIKAAYEAKGDADIFTPDMFKEFEVDGVEGEYKAEWTYVKEDETIKLPVACGYYCAIFGITPYLGCEGDTYVNVTGGAKPTKTNVIDEPLMEYFTFGKVAGDISNIVAGVEETGYHVYVYLKKAQSISYINTSADPESNVDVETIVEANFVEIPADIKKQVEKRTGINADSYADIFVPKGNFLAITDVAIIDGGTALTTKNIANEGKPCMYENLNYKQDNKELAGWKIGQITGPSPKQQLKDGNVVIDTPVVTAECNNYCMEVTTNKNGADISVAYKGDGVKKEGISSNIKYYTNIGWDEDEAAFESKGDIIVDARSNDNNYSLYKYKTNAQGNRELIQESVAEVVAKPYYVNGNVTKYADDEYELTLDLDKGGFVLSKVDIEDIEDLGEAYTSIEISIRPRLTITYPSIEKDNVEIYRYNEALVDMAAYRATKDQGDDSLLINDPELGTYNKYNALYHDAVKFVVFPAEGADYDYVGDYIVGEVAEKYGFKVNKSKHSVTDQDGKTITYDYYEMFLIERNMTVTAGLVTATDAIQFTVVNNTKTQAGGAYGEANFSSTNVNVIKTEAEKTTYKVNQGVEVVKFKIKEDDAKAGLKVVVNEGEDEEYELKPVSDPKNGEYLFEIRPNDIKDATLTISNEWEKRDIYVTYNEAYMELTVKISDQVFEPISSVIDVDLDGNKIYHYELPYSSKAIFNAKALDNCKVNYAYINRYKKNFDVNGNLTFNVSDSNNANGADFMIYAQPLETLYFGTLERDEDGEVIEDAELIMEPHTTNKFTTTADKEVAYAAYLRYGCSEVEEFGDRKRHNGVFYKDKVDLSKLTITAKIGSKDLTSTVITKTDDIMFLDFSNEAVAGNTVVITAKRGSATLATLNVKVKPYATSVKLTGESNNTITQELFSDKTYTITYNKDVDPKDIKVVYQYKGDDGKYYEFDSVISGKVFDFDQEGKKLAIKAIPEMDVTDNGKGMPSFRVAFIDTTTKKYLDNPGDSTAGVFAYKTLSVNMATLNSTSPTVKLVSASDQVLNLQITVPKKYIAYANGQYLNDKDGTDNALYCAVRATAVDGARPVSMKQSVAVCPIIVDEDHLLKSDGTTTVALQMAKPGYSEPGKGAGWKYNVTAQFYYGKDLIINTKGIVTGTKEYGASKPKTLSNLATKDPYYETKIAASAKTNKFYQNQENVNVAQAKFSANTTFYDLMLGIIDGNGNYVTNYEIGSGRIGQGANPADIYIYDTSGLIPGDYTLLMYSDPGSVPARVALTVYEPIVTGGFEIVTPSNAIYKKDNASASMTLSVKYDDNEYTGKKPKTQKVTWSVEKADGASDDFDITKYVSINNSGKVTVDKSFKFEEDRDNYHDYEFNVVATAADYADGGLRKTAPVTITITNSFKTIGGLKITSSNGTTLFSTDDTKSHKATSTEIGKVLIDYGTAKGKEENCTIKSSNKNIVIDEDCNIIAKAAGSTNITFTYNDGGKSSKTIKLEVVNKKYSPGDSAGLGLVFTEIDEHGYIDEDSFEQLDPDDEDANVKDYYSFVFTVSDAEGAPLEAITSYSVKAAKGCKLYSYNDEAGKNYYVCVPSAAVSVITLTDNMRVSKEVGRTQTFYINNDGYELVGTEKLSVSFTSSSLTPGDTTYLKVSGIKTDKTTGDPEGDYSVVLIPDEGDCRKKEDAYIAFAESIGNYDETVFCDAVDVCNVREVLPETKMTGFIADCLIETETGNSYTVPKGNYKFNAYIYKDGDLVCITPAVGLTMNAAKAPSISFVEGYSVIINDGTPHENVLRVYSNKTKNILGCRIDGLSDASVNGVRSEITKYFDCDENFKLKVIEGVTDEQLKKVKDKVLTGYLHYTYYDMAGKAYIGTQKIQIAVSLN